MCQTPCLDAVECQRHQDHLFSTAIPAPVHKQNWQWIVCKITVAEIDPSPHLRRSSGKSVAESKMLSALSPFPQWGAMVHHTSAAMDTSSLHGSHGAQIPLVSVKIGLIRFTAYPVARTRRVNTTVGTVLLFSCVQTMRAQDVVDAFRRCVIRC